MSHISKTAASILWDVINTGQTVVALHKTREVNAANELIAQGLVYLHTEGARIWLLKAGRRPFRLSISSNPSSTTLEHTT